MAVTIHERKGGATVQQCVLQLVCSLLLARIAAKWYTAQAQKLSTEPNRKKILRALHIFEFSIGQFFLVNYLVLMSKPTRKRQLTPLVVSTSAAVLMLCASAFVRVPVGGGWLGSSRPKVYDHYHTHIEPLHSFSKRRSSSELRSSTNCESSRSDDSAETDYEPIAMTTNIHSSHRGGDWRRTQYPMEPMLQIRPNLGANYSVKIKCSINLTPCQYPLKYMSILSSWIL